MLGRACRKRETMFDWIVQVIDQLGYAGILLLMLAETMFPPIPSEVIMPIAGVLAVRGEMSLTGIIISGTAGAMLGNFLWYLVARMIGVERFKPLMDRYGRWITMDWYDVQKAARRVGRSGRSEEGRVGKECVCEVGSRGCPYQ